MATISPTVDATSGGKGNTFIRLKWETVTDADTGGAIVVRDQLRRVARDAVITDMLVQMESGGASGFDGNTMTVEISEDGTNFHPAKDPSDTDLTFTAAGIKALRDIPSNARFSKTAGAGTAQDVDIWLTIRAQRR